MQSLIKECINQDNVTNSRELAFAKLNQDAKHGRNVSMSNYLALGVYRKLENKG
jgi:hypothetical protein